MRAFSCDLCHSLVAFENSLCVSCGSGLGLDRAQARLVATQSTLEGSRYTRADGSVLTTCANLDLARCNWLAEQTAPDGLCPSCLLTRTRPANDDPSGLVAFAATETAKRRLIYQLDTLGLPLSTTVSGTSRALCFDLISSEKGVVTPGYESGVITIDLAESTSTHRAQMLADVAGPYRPLLGYLRHEVGHWYREMLFESQSQQDLLRNMFGDERGSEISSVRFGWESNYVSRYAATHPSEDWAETFAHYLHLLDALETAQYWRIHVEGPLAKSESDLDSEPDTQIRSDAVTTGTAVTTRKSFDELLGAWLPLASALNAVNRSIGDTDLYPSSLASAVVAKLRFVHDRLAELR